MNAFLTKHITLSIHLIILACTLTLGAVIAQYEKHAAVEKLTRDIEVQIERMKTLALSTDRNEADPLIATVVLDCPRRSEFESLLGRLGELTKRDLLTVQQLFESCGRFHATQKAFTVTRLQREYEVLAEKVELLRFLDEDIVLDRRLTLWGSLVEKERMRSEYLTELTNIQEKIIISLIAHGSQNNEEVLGHVGVAQQIAESIAVVGKQIDTLRDELSS